MKAIIPTGCAGDRPVDVVSVLRTLTGPLSCLSRMRRPP
jgi:hypothetical protein